MSKPDLLQRFIFENLPVRGEYVHLQESLQTILSQHSYPPSVQKLLGEALCIASLLSAIIKFDGRLSVQFRGKGSLKLLLAQCDNEFHLRGLAKYDEEANYQALVDSFKEGVLIIMLDSSVKTQRYQGIVSWSGNSLAEAIEGYFRNSEQLPTKIWVEFQSESAVGFLLQTIPETKKHTDPNDNPHKQILNQLAQHVNGKDLFNLELGEVLSKYYPQEDIRVFKSNHLSFQCTCSRESGENAILILGKEETEAELKSKNSLVVTCDFCNEEYLFDKIDVANVFEKNEKLPPKTSLH